MIFLTLNDAFLKMMQLEEVKEMLSFITQKFIV
jgi:hypothetical protein